MSVMIFEHYGLTFAEANIKRMHKQAKRAPFKAAWERLRDDSAVPSDPLAAMQWAGLRHRLDDDHAAGEAALARLDEYIAQPLTADTPYRQSVADTLLLAHCFELLRDHPAYSDAGRARFFDVLFERTSSLSEREMTLVEQLWSAALNMATGIVLEREPVFQAGVTVYQRVVDDEIHPEGYLPGAVEAYPEVESLTNQLLAVQALVLMAEMAHHTGVNLWAYERRGVSALTAATYPLYYYYYPEEWKWNGEPYKPSDGVELETGQAIFQARAGFLEIINQRYDRPLRAVQLIVDELRPIYDPYCGGLTTLTHGLPERRGLFG